MDKKKQGIGRKIVRAGGWQVFKRGAKMLPFGGTIVVATLVGTDIRRKGLVNGLVNSGLDAVPFVGLLKNGIELFRGDFIPDKPERISSNGGRGKK